MTKKQPATKGDIEAEVGLLRDEFKERFDGIEKKIEHLPTKSELFEKLDELIGFKKIQDEETASIRSAIQRLTDDVNMIKDHLHLNET